MGLEGSSILRRSLVSPRPDKSLRDPTVSSLMKYREQPLIGWFKRRVDFFGAFLDRES